MSKAPLKPKFLNQKFRKVTLMDLLTLLYHVREGAQTPEVGFLDANNTIDSLTKRLNREAWIEQAALESGLWSCNLMNEVDKFHDYRGRTFDQLLKDVLGKDGYDKFFCTIDEDSNA